MTRKIPIFVINMGKDEGRRTKIADRFAKTGAELTFIEAVDGSALTPDQLSFYDGPKRRRYFGRDLTPGEIGCLLSHRAIFEKIMRESISYAVILEDDVIPEPDFLDAINALPDAPVKWDIVRFLGSKKIYARGNRKIAPLTGRYQIARLPTTPGGAHGYMVKLDTAKIFLKHMRKNWLPIDTLQGRMWETGLETLVLHPAPVHIDETMQSTIGDEVRMNKKNNLRGAAKIAYKLRRTFYRIGDTAGKRYIYWSSWPRDRRASLKN